jgi:excisionase family DNA binding protein
VTVIEAADLLRAKRYRVDDLLSRGTLTRIKDGSRTLIERAEIEAYLGGEPTGRRTR